jgi:hypothetical protein
MKKTIPTRGSRKRPPQPITTLLPVPRQESTQRPGPDPSDLALANVDEPMADELELFRPCLRFIPE